MSRLIESALSRSSTVPDPSGLRKIGRLPEPTAPRTLITIVSTHSFLPSEA